VLDVTGNINRYDDCYSSGNAAYIIFGMLQKFT